MFYALDEQLTAMERETYEKRFARHREMAGRFDRWANERGFANFVDEKYKSPTTANRRVGKCDIDKFIAGMLARGHELSHGYAKLRGQAFRVGHFGDHTMPELEKMLGVADEVLKGIGR
jgi:aspartate aminotransferase-like enzyme